MKKNQETKAFSQILDIIRTHRAGALASVNIEHLLSRWEIGAYISAKIKHDGWGNATIDRLVDYIHANAPDERGYGRRNLYNMVSVYEAFTSPEFTPWSSNTVIQLSSRQQDKLCRQRLHKCRPSELCRRRLHNSILSPSFSLCPRSATCWKSSIAPRRLRNACSMSSMPFGNVWTLQFPLSLSR